MVFFKTSKTTPMLIYVNISAISKKCLLIYFLECSYVHLFLPDELLVHFLNP